MRVVVPNRAFILAGRALELDGTESIGKIELDAASPTFELDPYARAALTAEDWFVKDATSAGSTVPEYFSFFTVDNVTYPKNAWLTHVGAVQTGGTPSPAYVGLGDLTAAPNEIVPLARLGVIDSGDVYFYSSNTYYGRWPVQIPYRMPDGTAGDRIPVTQATLIPGAVIIGLDPGAIGDDIRFTARVVSAPEGVMPWGAT